MKKVIITCLLLSVLVFISFGNCIPQSDICLIPGDNVSTTNDEDKPTLYAFIVGFKPPYIKFTIDDANDVEKALLVQKNMSNSLYRDVIIKKIIGEDATKTETLAQLISFIKVEDIKPGDVFMVFISSHGERHSRRKYYIQASNYDNRSPKTSSIALNELMEQLNKVKAKKLVFIDACQSGRGRPDPLRGVGIKGKPIHEASQIILGTKPGTTIITSSNEGDSYHHIAWKNGAFTEALLEGLEGAADTDGNKVITTGEIYEYISRRVPQLCKEQQVYPIQTPDYLSYDLGDFPFHTVSEGYTNEAPLPPARVVGVRSFTAYTINVKPKNDIEHQKWEQEPITLFHDDQDGERYLEGRIAFMGTQGKLGLRMQIVILGDATGWFGADQPIIVANVGKNKAYITPNYQSQYICTYDPAEHKTFYTMAYDIDPQTRKRLLHKKKVTSIQVGWQVGYKTYEVTQSDAFIRQLDNIERAQEDGIIEKIRR